MIDTPGGARRDDVLGAMNAGIADLLVAMRPERFAGEQPLSHLLKLNRGSPWRWAFPELGFEEGTEFADHIMALWARLDTIAEPGATAPLPPAELRERVTGSESGTEFDRGGRLHARTFSNAWHRWGGVSAESSILDFGCGYGRILRYLVPAVSAAAITGVDADQSALDWVAANLGVRTVRVDPLPPSPLPEAAFDLTLSYSVFTHLDEDYQDAWLAELARAMRPGGLLAITVLGEMARRWHLEHQLVRVPESVDRERAARGRAFWTDAGWQRHFGDYSHTMFHTPDYVERRWDRWFDVLEIMPAGSPPFQDLAVLRARERT